MAAGVVSGTVALMIEEREDDRSASRRTPNTIKAMLHAHAPSR